MFTFTSTYSISLLHLFMKRVQRNCLQNWEKTVLQKQEMSLEGLSQWERVPPLPFHTPSLSPPHSSPHTFPLPTSLPRCVTLPRMKSWCWRSTRGWTGSGNETRWNFSRDSPTPTYCSEWQHTHAHTHMHTSHTHMHTLTCTHTFTHHTLACTYNVCKQWFGASFTW